MELRLWQLSKRQNSTAIPTTEGYAIDVKLKEGCSLLQPSWLISGNVLEYTGYNYAKWNSRYYFLTNPTIVRNNLIELHGSVDVLATYQQYILNHTTYVERAAVAYDKYVNDPYVSQSYSYHLPTSYSSDQPPQWSEDGSFIVRIVSGVSNGGGFGISTYSLSSTQLSQLLESAFSDGHYDFLSDTSVKSFFNPFQYIVSVQYFPFYSGVFGSSDEAIRLGWWDTGVEGTIVVNPTISYSLTCNMPISAYDDFRLYDSRWSTLRIFIPSVGQFFINPAEVPNGVIVKYNIDVATGESFVKLHSVNNTSDILGCYSGKMCSNVAIGQLDINTGNVAKSLLSTASSVLSGNIFGAAGGIIDVATNISQPTPSLNGSAGNMSALIDTSRVTLTLSQCGSKEFPTQVLGRPVMAVRPLDMFTGYVKCGNASILIPGTSEERDQLNSLLNGGFYIE